MSEMNLWNPAQLAEYSLARLLGILPIDWASDIGALFGRQAARRAMQARRLWIGRLHANLAHYQGIQDAAERERRILEYMARIGRIHAEFMVQQKIVGQGRLEVVGEDILHRIDRPVIVASCHLANWELVGHVMAQLGRPGCDIFVPPANPVRRHLADEARQRWPVQKELVIAGTSTLRQVSKAIQRGFNILLFIDEEKDGYVSAPSLGRDIPYRGNRWFAARLAVKHGLDILPVHIEPAGKGAYRAVVEPLIGVPAGEDPDHQARQLADTLDDRLNTWIRPLLEHWYWLPYFDREAQAQANTAPAHP